MKRGEKKEKEKRKDRERLIFATKRSKEESWSRSDTIFVDDSKFNLNFIKFIFYVYIRRTNSVGA